MAEAVHHARTGGEARDGGAVVLLIEEEARLLAVLKVEPVEYAVLAHRDARGAGNARRAIPPAHAQVEALLLADGGVAALEDGAHVLAVLAQHAQGEPVEHLAPELHAVGAHLCDQHILVAVDHEARQPVRLGEDHAAAVQIGAHDAAAHLPCPAHLALPERIVDAVVGIARDDAHADTAQARVESGALPGAVLLDDVDDGAVLDLGGAVGKVGESEHLAVEEPDMPGSEAAGGLACDDDLRIRALLLHQTPTPGL